MKKLIVVSLLLLIVGCSSGNKGIPFNPKEVLNEEDSLVAFRDSEANKGKFVSFSGRIFNLADEDDKYFYYQVFTDFENSEGSLLIKINKEENKDVKVDDFLSGEGVIIGTMEGTNAFGAKISSASVEAVNIKFGSFKDTVGKAHTTVNVNDTKSQNGHFVTLEKIEFSDYDTRVYLKVENKSKQKISMYQHNITLIVDGKNYEEQYSFYEDYPELESSLHPETSSSTVLSFKKIDISSVDKAKLIIDRPYGDDWTTDFENYVFEISLK